MKWREKLGKLVGETLANQGVKQPLNQYGLFAYDCKKIQDLVEQTLSEDRQKQRLALTEKIGKMKLLEVAVSPERFREKLMYNQALDKVLKVIQEKGKE